MTLDSLNKTECYAPDINQILPFFKICKAKVRLYASYLIVCWIYLHVKDRLSFRPFWTNREKSCLTFSWKTSLVLF